MKIRSCLWHTYHNFHKHWAALSRPLRVLILLVGTALAFFFLYIFLDSPALTDEQRFRRAERANLVGPANILDIRQLPKFGLNYYDRMLVADDGDGVIMYLWNTKAKHYETLTYRKKVGDVTIYAAPIARSSLSWNGLKEIILPVYAFDNVPDAARAELDITLNYDINSKTHTYQYALESTREKSGFFCFYIHIDSQSNISEAEAMALEEFSRLTCERLNRGLIPDCGAFASIRLYDKDNMLLHKETLNLCTSLMESLIEHDAPH